MLDPVQILAIAVSGLLLLLVLELVRRRLLGEEYALLWITGGIALLVLSVSRRALDSVARWLGVHYGPAMLLLLLAFFVFIALLFFSVVVSRQRVQIERLIEDQAILEAVQRELAARSESGPQPWFAEAGSAPQAEPGGDAVGDEGGDRSQPQPDGSPAGARSA